MQQFEELHVLVLSSPGALAHGLELAEAPQKRDNIHNQLEYDDNCVVDGRLADMPADAAPPDVLASVHQYAAMQLWSDGWSVDDIAEVMALNPDIVRRLVH